MQSIKCLKSRLADSNSNNIYCIIFSDTRAEDEDSKSGEGGGPAVSATRKFGEGLNKMFKQVRGSLGCLNFS